jgi:DNA topoisomerase-3
MKDRGLGTPATRASIVETLLKRGYITRDAKHLRATPMGITVIDALPIPTLASPVLTGEWEARLARMARGEETRAAFMQDIERFVREAVDAVRATAPPANAGMKTSTGEAIGRCPRCGNTVIDGARGFVCSSPGKPCTFLIPKTIAGRTITAALAKVLLAKRRTQTLGGFRAKGGLSLRAAIAIDDTGEVKLAFGGRGERAPNAIDERDVEAERGPSARSSSRGGRRTRRGAPTSAAPSRPEPRAKKKADSPKIVFPAEEIPCPRCKQAMLMTGKRGWGCTRWKEGCGFVVWFEQYGKKLSASQLADLVVRGKTRTARWIGAHGESVKGTLRLDAHRANGTMPLEVS